MDELKDCPKCGSGMKLSEKPLCLPICIAKNGELRPSDEGIAVYTYLCLSCLYLELYANVSEETLRQRPPLSA